MIPDNNLSSYVTDPNDDENMFCPFLQSTLENLC